MSKELQKGVKRLEVSQNMLQIETVKRISCESEIADLKERIHFNNELHKQVYCIIIEAC